MLNVVLSVQSCDVGATESSPAVETKQVESPKIVSLAQGVLSRAFLIVDGKEFGGDDLTAILSNGQLVQWLRSNNTHAAHEALQMKHASHCPDELTQ